MRSRWGLAAVVAVAMAGSLASVAMARGGDTGTSRRRSRYDRTPSRYYVISVLSIDGEMQFEVVGDIDFKARRKEIEEEYQENVLDWKKAYREAKRAKEPFTEKPPRGPKFHKKWKSFKDEERAQEYADKIQEAWDAQVAKMRAKRGKKAPDDFADDRGDDEKRDHKRDEDDEGEEKDKKKRGERDKDEKKK